MNQKQSPRISDQKVFISLDDLPSLQRQSFLQWVPRDVIYSVSTTHRQFGHCVDYMMYAYWFDKHFSRRREENFHELI
jgi:hypothetical protein